MAGQDDALLLVELMRWGTESGALDATYVVIADNFDPGTASVTDASVRKVLTFYEVIGTLVKHGLLSRDLVLDVWSIAALWRRLGPVVLRERKRLDAERLYENCELLAGDAA